MVEGREPRTDQFRPAWGLPGHFAGAGATTAGRDGSRGASGAPAPAPSAPSDAARPGPRGPAAPAPAPDYGEHRAWSEVAPSGTGAGAGVAAGAGTAAGAAAGAGAAAESGSGTGNPYADPGERAEPLEYGVDPEAPEASARGSRPGRAGRTGRTRDRLPSWLTTRRAAYIGVGVFIFLALAYGVDIATSIGKVPRGSEVAGVAVGSMSYPDAEKKLVDTLGPRLSDPVALRAGAVSTELDPEKVGLSVDWTGTLDRAGEQPLNPFTRFVSLFTSHEVGIESRIPDQRLTGYLESLGRQANLDPREGAVWFDKDQVKSVLPRDGQSLRVEDSRQAVLDHWLDEGGVELAVDFTPTQTKEDQVRDVVTKIAEPAVRAPVDVVGSHLLEDGSEPAKKDVPLTVAPAPGTDGGENAAPAGPQTSTVNMVPADDPDAVTVQFPLDRIGEYLTFEQHGDAIEPIYNAEAAKGILDPLLESTQAKGRDASFAFSGNSVTVVPSVMGRNVQWGPLLGKLQAGLQDRGPRTVPVTYESTPPALDTEKANQAGIREKVGESTINVPPGSSAQQMLADINGHLVGAGGTADLSELSSTVSGSDGADAVATAFFNAAYEAGMTELRRTPRGSEDPAFPPARDVSASAATSFRNPQGTGVVIEAFPTGTGVTVRLWGTKQYEVRSQDTPRTDVVRAGTRRVDTEGCTPSAGKDGYTVENTRIVQQGTREVSRDTFKSTYAPVDGVTCVAPPRTDDNGDRPTSTTPNSPAPAPGVPAPPPLPDLPQAIRDLIPR